MTTRRALVLITLAACLVLNTGCQPAATPSRWAAERLAISRATNLPFSAVGPCVATSTGRLGRATVYGGYCKFGTKNMGYYTRVADVPDGSYAGSVKWGLTADDARRNGAECSLVTPAASGVIRCNNVVVKPPV